MIRTKHVRLTPKHYPQGIQGDRNPLGTPFSSIFRRATKDGASGGPEKSSAVGENEKQKDHATGDPRLPNAPSKYVTPQNLPPPYVISILTNPPKRSILPVRQNLPFRYK